MAVVYAVSEFTDEKGTDWKVKIVDGTISSGDLNHAFALGPDGFRLTYDFDNFDRAKPIIGSKVDITLFHPDDNDAVFNTLYSNLDTAEEGTYRLEIYRDPDGTNETWWVGEILPEQTIIPDAYPHAAVSIKAADGLGNLKGIDYNNDGSPYDGTSTIITHIYKALSKVHSANFWGGSDILCSFFEDFIGAEYKTHIGVGQNQQLNNAWVEHNTFYNLDQEGNKKYFNSYEILEGIATAFNSCIFMAQGRFWFVPLGALQGHGDGDLNIYHELRGGGAISYNTSTNVTFAAAFGNNSADFEKLAGWERSSTPAFKEVKRVRNYQGDKPLLHRSILAMDTLIQDEDADRPAGQELLVNGRLKYWTGGISGYSGVDLFARLKLSVTLRVGDAGGTSKYLSRAVSFSAASVQSIGSYEVQLPVFAEPTWETSSASRYEIVTDVFFISNGMLTGPTGLEVFTGQNNTFLTPPILADAEGLQLEFDLAGIDHEGNVVAAWTDTSNDVYYQMENAGVFVYDDEYYQEFGSVDITATNALDARYKMKQGQTLIGDKITDSDLGIVKIYNGSANVDSTQWTSLQSSTASLSLNGLGVRERLAANKFARRVELGTLYNVGSKFLHPYSILTNSDEAGTKYYQVTGLKHIAARCEYDLECMYLNRDITDVTVAQDNGKPSKGDPFPTVAIGQKGPSLSDDTVLEANSAKLASVTTDTYGITALKISDGASTTWNLTPPTSAASAGETELMVLRDNGGITKLANGTAGQVLTVNAGETAALYADATSGWLNSATLMKVMPTQFIMNDDYNRAPVMVEDDVAGYLGIKAPSVNTELYAFVAIPTGYKATHTQVYASASTSSAVTVYSFNQTSGAIVSKGTGDLNSSINITDITSSTTINLVIKLALASTATVIYGADVTIIAV